MKNTFWKALGVLLLLYVFSMTLLVPLGPGLLEFQDKGKVQHSDIVGRSLPVYEVIGFGTHWDENSDSLSIFVKSKGQLAALEIFEITDETHALVGLDLPYSIPSKSWNVLVNHPIDGTLLLENALFLSDRCIRRTSNTCGSRIWEQPAISFPISAPNRRDHPQSHAACTTLVYHVLAHGNWIRGIHRPAFQ
jgi:hypothetical protein